MSDISPIPDSTADEGTPDEDGAAARRRRNVVLALGLVAFVVLIFVLTLVRLKENVVARPL